MQTSRFILCLSVVIAMLSIVTQSAVADDIAYMETGFNQFGTIDLTTGVFTKIATTTTRVGGLGYAIGQFYGWQDNGNQVLGVNPATGVESGIGNHTLPSTVGNLASAANGLVAMDEFTGNLLSINPNTGVATLIGPTGLANYYGIGNGLGNNIYVGLGGADTLLYSVNTTTGAATLLGDTGVAFAGAFVWVNGTLYAGSNLSGQFAIYKLNPTTYQGTFVADLTGTSNGDFWGLGIIGGSAPVVPEPSSLALFGAGLIPVLNRLRRYLSR